MVDPVLVAADDPSRASALQNALADGGVSTSVGAVTSLDQLFDVLCYERVACLVLSADAGPTDARFVERGLRALYPDLPVVLVGDAGGPEVTGDATVRVETTDVADERVAAAVADALDRDPDSAANRPPSRLETLLMSVFEGFPVHLYAKDERARHVIASDSSVDLADVIGRTDLTLSHGHDDQHHRAIREDRRVVESHDPVLETEEYIDGDQTEYAVTSKVPWYGRDGAVVGLAGITLDITERKRRERDLRRQNERLAKVALVAAHELRNELQVASGRMEVLPEDTPQADIVRASHERLSGIVDDIVEMASQERVGSERAVVWLSTLAREVWDTYDTPTATLQVAADRRVSAHPESLRILFEVLLSNAVDHGGESVTVTIAATDDGFVVADDGPGIAVEPPDRVFDAGFAGSSDNDGFGLYVARRVADEHGWTLHAENGSNADPPDENDDGAGPVVDSAPGAWFVVSNVGAVDDGTITGDGPGGVDPKGSAYRGTYSTDTDVSGSDSA